MNNAQYAELFLTESREHVSAINHSLLELERGVAGSDAAAAVSAIFRAVHTLKGLAGLFGATGRGLFGLGVGGAASPKTSSGSLLTPRRRPNP